MYPRSLSVFVAASSVLQITVATTVPIVSCSVNQPQLFTNPSFEEGSLAGWTITSNSANAAVLDAASSNSPFSTAADGQYYIDTYDSAPRGGAALFMSQTLNGLDISTIYTITYSIAGQPHGSNSQNCNVYFFKDSQTNANLLVENIHVMGANGLPWTQYSLDFTPTASSHLIIFALECYSTDYYAGIDNIQFLAPATTVCSTSYSTVAASTPTPTPSPSSSSSSSQAVATTLSSSAVVSTAAASTPTPSLASSSAAVSSSAAIPSSAAVTSAASSVASPSTTPTPSSTIISSEPVPTTTSIPEPDDGEDDGCPSE